jgi:hypothetical protein
MGEWLSGQLLNIVQLVLDGPEIIKYTFTFLQATW